MGIFPFCVLDLTIFFIELFNFLLFSSLNFLLFIGLFWTNFLSTSCCFLILSSIWLLIFTTFDWGIDGFIFCCILVLLLCLMFSIPLVFSSFSNSNFLSNIHSPSNFLLVSNLLFSFSSPLLIF